MISILLDILLIVWSGKKIFDWLLGKDISIANQIVIPAKGHWSIRLIGLFVAVFIFSIGVLDMIGFIQKIS